ncbi:hypothetical protein [Reyranella sp.]|uniref:hypothetical protein n=1 Tax=Reyranella sp. TaxID=1929291 RepID=UPI003BAA79E0
MARKRPSSHSKEQFALFLARVGDSFADSDETFDSAVDKLLRRGRNGNGHPAATSTEGEGPRTKARSLPETPDFDAIERAARDSRDGQANLFALIGQLVVGWSNNESLLIYVLMLLLETEERSAAVVFSTLNTTRARLDLVRRLMLLKVRDPGVRNAMDSIVRRLADAGRARNEFLHAMFSVDESGQITHTQAMRLSETKGRFSFGDREPLDANRLSGLRRTLDELRALNRDLWAVLPRLREAVGREGPSCQVPPAAPPN